MPCSCHVDRSLLIQRNEHETDVCNKYLFRFKLACFNAGLVAENRKGSGRSCDKPTRRILPWIFFFDPKGNAELTQ